MSGRKSTSQYVLRALCFITVILSGCVPVGTQPPQIVPELATPTPEIYHPLDPSPTPSDSRLPMTCQVADLNVYVNHGWGYCFAYPVDFTQDESRAAEGILTLYGPALEENAGPIRVSLELTTQVVPHGSELNELVTAYLMSFRGLPGAMARRPWRLGSEPAEMLEPVPGLLSSRLVLALHENILFTLHFHPSDLEIANAGLEALTQTVTGSFAFLATTALPVPQLRTVSWYEFGENISLS